MSDITLEISEYPSPVKNTSSVSPTPTSSAPCFPIIDHSIGLLIVHTQDITDITASLEYEPGFIHLQLMNLVVGDDFRYPIVPIGHIMYDSGFKFKSFVRLTLKRLLRVKKKYISCVKFIGTTRKYIHNYLVVLSKKIPLQEYQWYKRFDFFSLTHLNPTRGDIIQAILHHPHNKDFLILGQSLIPHTGVQYHTLLHHLHTVITA